MGVDEEDVRVGGGIGRGGGEGEALLDEFVLAGREDVAADVEVVGR
jgi:hypothetical protein